MTAKASLKGNSLLVQVRKELKKNTDPAYQKGATKFFKEKVKILGVRTPIVRKIAGQYSRLFKDKPKKEIFALCEELLRSDQSEEKTIAFSWVFSLKNQFEKSDFKLFKKWLNQYVNNWAACDDFCTHAFGHLLFLYPQFTKEVLSWTKSRNRWLRRGSVVLWIYVIKRKKILKTVFQVSEKLLLDEDDLVQKGYGWLLKETSNLYQQEVFDFVIKHKKEMPRTALRYAIEKMPVGLKKKAMARD